MKTFGDVIGLWPSLADFAANIGVPYEAAKGWRWRNSIPAAHWQRVIAVAQERGFEGVTAERLTEIARRRSDRVARKPMTNIVNNNCLKVELAQQSKG